MSRGGGRKRSVARPGAPAVLVPSKLRPPHGRERLVARPRLLPAGTTERVVVVQAPAGYGKTSLLAQWAAALEERHVRVGWVRLDEDDDQAPRLLLHLAAAMIGDAPGREETLAGLVADLQVAPSGVLRMVDRLPWPEGPFALFLDELEHVVDADAVAVVRRVVDRLPAEASLIVASRTAPRLGLPRLRVSGLVHEVNAADLRFEEDEAAALFANRGLALARADVAELRLRTEGWAAALHLSALAMSGRREPAAFIRSLGGTNADITDYLAEDVLGRQDERVRRFLLETSVLRRLTAPLCDAVTRRRDGRAMLEKLHAAGLFVTALDEERRWHRYHPLFARFLQGELGRRAPRRVARLHRAAARWYARNDDSIEAVHHAMAAGDHALAASLMETAAKELNRQGLFSTVVRWRRELPKRVLDEHPAIRAAAAWAHLFHRDFESADRELAEIERLRRRRRLAPRVEDDVRIVAPIMAGHRDRIAETLELSREALARLHGVDPFDRGALRDSLAYGLTAAGRFEEARAVLVDARADHLRSGSLLGSVYTATIASGIEAIQGNLDEASALHREAERLAQDRESGAPSHLGAIVAGYAAELLYERDRLAEAEARVDRHLELAIESAVVDMAIAAVLAAARTRYARGAADEAFRILGEGEVTGLRRAWPRLVAAVRWERVRFAVLAGAIGEARAHRSTITEDLIAAEQAPLRPHAGETEAQSIGELRLWIRSGEASRAVAPLASERRRADAEGRVWRGLRLRILEAEAHEALDRREAALRSLREALRIGAPRGFVRSFADEGRPITSLVRAIRAESPEEDPAIPRAATDAILRAAGEPIDAPAPDAAEARLDRLSRREREILELLSLGLSNRALARRLYVSENTVKFHLKAIFEKLGVSSRARAIAVAGRKNHPFG